MKKHNILIGLGLLSAAGLSSCKDEFIDNNVQAPNSEELRIFTAEAGLETFGINDTDKSSRANVEDNGTSFLWNTNDAVSIWDGASGNFKFSVPEDYNDSEPKNKLVFTGTAALDEGAKVWGIYPYYESGVLTDKQVKFTLPETVTITKANKPALQNTMFMVAEGEVKGENIEKLNFKHLTGIFQFNITNTKTDAEIISSVSVTASSEVFPTVSTGAIGDDKNITYTYSENKAALTLNFPSETSLNNNETVTAYMSFLPSQGITADTELTFSVNGAEVLKGKISELYDSNSAIATNGYEAGKRYIINLTTEKKLPDTGYEVEGNNYTVYNAKGLKALLGDSDVTGSEEKIITLNTDIDFTGTELTPITDFKATLDGNDKYISNYTLSAGSGNHYGLIKTNSGTIKNLTVKDVTLEASVTADNDGASAFVGKNSGTIINCKADNMNLKLTSGKAALGAIVGNNSGTIKDITIENSTVETTVNCNAGFMAGINTGTIAGCYISSSNTMKSSTSSSANAALGGLIGWAQGTSKVYACGSSAKFEISDAAVSCGGLIAANVGTVELSYSANEITDNHRASSIGAFVTNANGNSSYTKCYTTTNATYGFYKGKGTPTFSKCYTTGTQSDYVGTDLTTNATAESIKTSLENQEVTVDDVTYKFVTNTGNDSDIRPLIIEKQ